MKQKQNFVIDYLKCVCVCVCVCVCGGGGGGGGGGGVKILYDMVELG